MSEAKSAWLAKGVFDVKMPSGTLIGLRFPEPEDAVRRSRRRTLRAHTFDLAGDPKVDAACDEALEEVIGGNINADQARETSGLMNHGWVIAAVITVDGEPTEVYDGRGAVQSRPRIHL